MQEVELTSSRVNGANLYHAVWRWHFYVSLFVIPFLLCLTLSGLLMLVSKPIDQFMQRKLTTVTPQAQMLPPATLMEEVLKAYPDKHVQLYIPPRTQSEAARFSLIHTANVETASFRTSSITVFQNPYTGEILGSLDPGKTLYTQLKIFHGSLYIGDFGDRLVETASGLAMLMVLSGLYLAWPRRTRKISRQLTKRPLQRKAWRYLHKVIGLAIALPMVFFLLSGLAWTGVWGGKLVQPWSAIPKPDFGSTKNHHSHESLNREGIHQVPWALEKTPLPELDSNGSVINLDDIKQIAEDQGFETYRVNLPGGSTQTWIISATTMAGDILNPQADRTIHIDPTNRYVLADLKFADYPLAGKAMAAGIALHEGDLGLWNMLLNLFLVALMVFMIVSGLILWWKRRPSCAKGLLPPKASPGLSTIVGALALVISLCFPLSAVALVLMIVLDWLLVSRVTPLKVALK